MHCRTCFRKQISLSENQKPHPIFNTLFKYQLNEQNKNSNIQTQKKTSNVDDDRFLICPECFERVEANLKFIKKCDEKNLISMPNNENLINCLLCGAEGDLNMIKCCSKSPTTINTNKINIDIRFHYFCSGCLMANCGAQNFEEITRLSRTFEQKCFLCETQNFPNNISEKLDLKFRIKAGAFSNHTFFQFDSMLKQETLLFKFSSSNESPHIPLTYSDQYRKCISTSLFVNLDKEKLEPTYGMQYLIGLSMNIDKFMRYWKGQILRVQYDVRSLSRIQGLSYTNKILRLFAQNPYIELVPFPDQPQYMDKNGNYKGLFGTLVRYLTMGETHQDVVVVRDTDSLYSQLDFRYQTQFIADSSKYFHIYRCNHYHFDVLGGGISGCRRRNKLEACDQELKAIQPDIQKQILEFGQNAFKKPWIIENDERFLSAKKPNEFPYFCDQKFLEDYFLPKIENENCQIDRICIETIHTPQKYKSPSKRHNCTLKFTNLMNQISLPQFVQSKKIDRLTKAQKFIDQIQKQGQYRKLHINADQAKDTNKKITNYFNSNKKYESEFVVNDKTKQSKFRNNKRIKSLSTQINSFFQNSKPKFLASSEVLKKKKLVDTSEYEKEFETIDRDSEHRQSVYFLRRRNTKDNASVQFINFRT